MIPLELYILLASIMFTIGLYGLVTQKNGVKLMMCIELLLNSANINLVAFSSYQPNMNGQVFALFSIALVLFLFIMTYFTDFDASYVPYLS